MASIARAGLRFIMPAFTIAALLTVLVALFPFLVLATVAALTWALACFFLFFFRDPDRPCADGIVCPADGIIHRIWDEEGFVAVATFMNVHNVHVNRVPLDGRVVSVEHRPGGYLPAYKKESIRNERFITELDTGIGRVRVVQIAGVLVRRIIPYIKPGDSLARNGRLGVVAFGSRVDTYLPKDKVRLAVKVGDRVYAGSTTLARAVGKE